VVMAKCDRAQRSVRVPVRTECEANSSLRITKASGSRRREMLLLLDWCGLGGVLCRSGEKKHSLGGGIAELGRTTFLLTFS
jgi:hypothetical protein